jgi:hypothetical protein
MRKCRATRRIIRVSPSELLAIMTSENSQFLTTGLSDIMTCPLVGADPDLPELADGECNPNSDLATLNI